MQNGGMDESLTAKTVDIGLVATDWWRENGGRLLPGEGDGLTVFEVLYEDGCRYFGFTKTGVFQRLGELSNGSLEVRSGSFVVEHCRQMYYVVRCVASGLDKRGAKELREMLVVAAPDGVARIDGTTAVSPKCWLQEDDDDVEVMTFAEWAKTGNGGLK